MFTLVVKLPCNRDYCGELSLISADGGILAGPFKVAGRANTSAAVQAGNPERSPLLPYGDTPTGQYRLVRILKSGAGTSYHARIYGGHGILVLSGASGDAALAEASGRFHLFIQGGPLYKDGRLCSTNGALRMRNADLAALLALLKTTPQKVDCWCVNDSVIAENAAVYTGNKYNEGDPPILLDATQGEAQLSRRRMMGAGAALSSVQLTRVLLPGFFIGTETLFSQPALAAYDDNSDNGNTNSNDNGNNDNSGGTNNNGNSSNSAY